VKIRHYCPECMARTDLPDLAAREACCTGCRAGWAFTPSGSLGDGAAVERCAFCGNRAFFIQRDFDQRIGCVIMAASVALALFIGWKFGWIYFTPVLLATVLIDWVLAFRIKAVTICYRCDAEYREATVNPRHRNYDPHVAERFATVKTVRRMRS
jgi:hypothetical protein